MNLIIDMKELFPFVAKPHIKTHTAYVKGIFACFKLLEDIYAYFKSIS